MLSYLMGWVDKVKKYSALLPYLYRLRSAETTEDLVEVVAELAKEGSALTETGSDDYWADLLRKAVDAGAHEHAVRLYEALAPIVREEIARLREGDK